PATPLCRSPRWRRPAGRTLPTGCGAARRGGTTVHRRTQPIVLPAPAKHLRNWGLVPYKFFLLMGQPAPILTKQNPLVGRPISADPYIFGFRRPPSRRRSLQARPALTVRVYHTTRRLWAVAAPVRGEGGGQS